MSDFGATRTESRQAENLKSFGRRRRTKVVDERTRGEQVPLYGEFDFQPMPGTVRLKPRHVWRIASLRNCRTVRGFLILE
jgi:hypothetical protein